ncbi:MAG: thioredoxin domain-containing protein [Myxococcota bacterium]
MSSFSKTAPQTLGLALLLGLALPSCRPKAPADDPPDRDGAAADPTLPGVDRPNAELDRKLRAALVDQGPGYVPRTHHLRADGSPTFTNRLIGESSPYLLQHAHNPVNWYPWSEEAFARAKRENKPVFLSVGYSTCHWCHVMERESFEDEEIAAFLNRHFIAIKVDREERPDVDSVYMTAVQTLTGRGGWPMTVIMTPDKDPFFGGTYFPPRRGLRGARAGLIDILEQTSGLYRDDPTRAIQQAQELSQRIERITATSPATGVPSDRVLVTAVQRLAAGFDPAHGGFGRAPKFPQPSRLSLLLRYARRTGDPGALRVVTTTLDHMADGGVYDQIGGGFHRYSTDATWLVPHFEKMLYDNAQLALVYLEAWQFTGDARYRRVAADVLDYVGREMTAPGGGFYSATDADSPTPGGHDEEGWFFTWTPAELESLLGPGDAAIVMKVYGVSVSGNFEGRSIFHRALSDRDVASALRVSTEQVNAAIDRARPVLYEARAERPPPIRDEKVIAAWNGLMISAFARGGWVLDDENYLARAERAADFVLAEMRAGDGRLQRTYKDGRRAPRAFLDDYAFVVGACLDLYEATADLRWLDAALALQGVQDASHWDPNGGGYFMTANDGETLLVREKPTYDGAVPSGNSIAALNLLRLHDFTGDPAWRDRAEALLVAFGQSVSRAPTAYPKLLAALDYYYDVPREVAIVSPSAELTKSATLASVLRSMYVPNKVFSVTDDAKAEAQQARVPWLEGKRAIRDAPTAYVCERGRCDLPTSKPRVFRTQVDKRVPYPSYAEAPPPPLSVP